MDLRPDEPRVLKVAMGQMLVVGGRPEENLERARGFIQRAARMSAEIIVLPECLDLGWTHPSARELAQPVPGPHVRVLADAAAQAGIHVAAGVVERDGAMLYNTAVLISPSGEIILKHRKINELSIAFDLYDTGTSLGAVDTPLGRVGLNICADNFSCSLALGHVLGRMCTQILVSPSAWAVPAGHDNAADPYGPFWIQPYSELARLYDMPVVGVSNVGPIEAGVWAGMKCIGASIAVGAGGELITQLPYGEEAEALEVIDVTVLPRAAKGTDLIESLNRKGYGGP